MPNSCCKPCPDCQGTRRISLKIQFIEKKLAHPFFTSHRLSYVMLIWYKADEVYIGVLNQSASYFDEYSLKAVAI